MIGLFNFFKAKARYPLCRDADATRFLSGLPAEDPAQALDDITHELRVLASESSLKSKDRAAELIWLDQAAQHFERHLRQEYIAASRLDKRVEERIWTASAEFLKATIHAHERCLTDVRDQRTPAEYRDIALIAMRTMRHLDRLALWSYLRYEPVPTAIWEKAFSLIRFAEEYHLMDRPAILNPATSTQTSLKHEIVKLLMLSVSIPEQLTKTQIDLAHRLTHNLAGDFIWQETPGHRTVFCIDLTTPRPPARLINTSGQHFTLRGFGPGETIATLISWRKQLAQGSIPAGLNLSDPILYRREDVLAVLTHLSQRWNRINPTREHLQFDIPDNARQPQFSRIRIVHDFHSLHDQLSKVPDVVPMTLAPTSHDNLAFREQIDINSYGIISPNSTAQIKRITTTRALQPNNQDQSEIWVVEHISKMGYGVTLSPVQKEDWLKPNIIIGIKPVAANWQIGIVRRLSCESVEHTAVGIQLLSNQPTAVLLRPTEAELHVRETSADNRIRRTPAILLPRELSLQQENCLLLPSESYRLLKTYEMVIGEIQYIVRLRDRVQSYHGLDKVVFESTLP